MDSEIFRAIFSDVYRKQVESFNTATGFDFGGFGWFFIYFCLFYAARMMIRKSPVGIYFHFVEETILTIIEVFTFILCIYFFKN